MSGKKSGGRPASYDHAHVRTALEMWCSQFGRVPTHLDRVSGDDIHSILMARFGVSDTIRPESLQKSSTISSRSSWRGSVRMTAPLFLQGRWNASSVDRRT